MARVLTVAAAQLGPIAKSENRASVVTRMLDLMNAAKRKRCDLVVFPELALTTFFPRWYMTDQTEIDQWFEAEMPNHDTEPLFDMARQSNMAFHLGYAELCTESKQTHHYNSAILVDKEVKLLQVSEDTPSRSR
ncbi:MAG: hypothetical protein CM1200mP18_20920 [Gammaproteobacteria bacterium]|nr:MAG: hypothetical protein CM1200mP18_20920 [Gammaproteobacteria bacterium]